MPRGENPNSQRNLVSGKNKKPNSKKTPMQLSESARETARIAGGGNMTEGVERILEMYKQIDSPFLESKEKLSLLHTILKLIPCLESKEDAIAVLEAVLSHIDSHK